MENNRLELTKLKMDKLEQNVTEAKDAITLAQAELGLAKRNLSSAETKLASAQADVDYFRKRHATELDLVGRIEAKKRLKIEIQRLIAIRHNMNNNDNNNGNGGNSTTKSDVNVWMPLELHCELFGCLPLFFQRRLIPELCSGIYAIKGKELKRKLKRLNKWQHWDKSRLEVSDGRRTVKCITTKYDWATVRAAHPFTFQSSSHCQMHGHRICYFEVKIVVVAKDGLIRIGLCDGNFPLCREWIGDRANSFAIDSYGRVWMANMIVRCSFGWIFGQGDVIGCGLEIGAVNDGQQHLFFTKNGTICVTPFQLPASANDVELFPAVTLRQYRNQIEANFGGNLPFKYDLTKHNSAKQ